MKTLIGLLLTTTVASALDVQTPINTELECSLVSVSPHKRDHSPPYKVVTLDINEEHNITINVTYTLKNGTVVDRIKPYDAGYAKYWDHPPVWVGYRNGLTITGTFDGDAAGGTYTEVITAQNSRNAPLKVITTVKTRCYHLE